MDKFILLGILILSQCTREHSYLALGVIENQSGALIQIFFFKDGNSDTEFQVSIAPDNKVQVSIDEITYPGLLATKDFDSLVVKFDKGRESVHYGFNKLGNNSDAILYNSHRSLFNEMNYTRRIIIDKKYKHESEYTFTVIEQDYLDAK